MINNHSVLAIILARGQSKRLPEKNLKPIAGKPMIAWTIEASLGSKYIDRTIVSSEDEAILSTARQFGAETPFTRPIELAADSSSSEAALIHTLEWLQQNEQKTYDWIVYLQPTSPLRTADDITSGLEYFDQHQPANSLVSVTNWNKKPEWIHVINEQGYLAPYFKSPYEADSNSPQYFLPNGALYIFNSHDFLIQKRIYTDQTLPFVMPPEKSIDIDYIDEFNLAEYYMNRKANI